MELNDFNGMQIQVNGEKEKPPSYGHKAVLAQFIATFGNALIAFSIGMILATPPIVIGAVLKTGNASGSLLKNETMPSNATQVSEEGILHLSEEEASWYGSLLFVVQPLGCLLGALLQNYIGRKHGLILVNVPEVIGWFLLYKASSVNTLYISSILLGITQGFVEAPVLAYVCEICEPRLRGIFNLYVGFNVALAMAFQFLIAIYFDWRGTVLISMMVSLLSLPVLAIVPDSPVWLLAKGRKKEALSALCWLRGWVCEKEVATEFNQLRLYVKSHKLHSEGSVDIIESAKQTLMNDSKTSLLGSLCEPATRRALWLLLVFGLSCQFASAGGAKNYIIPIFKSLYVPIRPETLAFTSTLAGMLGSILCMLTLKTYGKRRITLISMMLCSILSILIGIYTWCHSSINMPWIAIPLFSIFYFAQLFGSVPWIMMGEIFSQKIRSTCVGLVAACFYEYMFVVNMTYMYLEHWVGTHGCFITYGTLGIAGVMYLYVYLPETEGKTLVQIEEIFTSDKKKPEHFRK